MIVGLLVVVIFRGDVLGDGEGLSIILMFMWLLCFVFIEVEFHGLYFFLHVE